MRLALVCFYCLCVFVYVLYFIATMSFAGYFLSVLFCLLSMLISDSRFDLVWFRLSCDHGWIRSGSVNVRKQQQQQQQQQQPTIGMKWTCVMNILQKVSDAVWSSHTTEYGSTGEGCQSCSWSAEQGKLIFPCHCSRLRIWSRETGLAVPSRVSPFILHTQAKSGAYSRDSSRFPRRRPHIPSTTIESVPSLSLSRSCVPMALTTESAPAQGQ